MVASVFDRHGSFDPRVDPTVRVEVGRLRSKLREYYETAGGRGPVRIRIPRGTYIPVFESHSVSVNRGRRNNGNAVAVLPFTDLTAGGNDGRFCDGLAVEIANALGRAGVLDVVANTSAVACNEDDVRQAGECLNATAVLEGGVRRLGNRVRVTTRLVSTEDGYCLWSDCFEFAETDALDMQIRVAEGVIRGLEDRLREAPKC